MPNEAESPYKRAVDSPSRQLLWELAQLHLNDRTSFYSKLEQDAHQREEEHRAALAAAAAEHDRIRRRAELEREKLKFQLDEEQSRREARQQKLIDTQRRLKAEKALREEQKELARAQALEEENRKLAEVAKAKIEAQRKAQEAQAEIDAAKKAQAEQESAAKEAAKKAVEDAQQRKREEAARAVSQASLPAAPATLSIPKPQHIPQPNPPVQRPASIPSTLQPITSTVTSLMGHLDPERVAEHHRYLEIHKNLKNLRRAVAREGESNKPFKTAVGESRRAIRKCVGQITDVKGANERPLEEIRKLLTSAAQFPEPSVPIDRFLARRPNDSPPGTSASVSVALVYLLNILSKSFLAQCTNDLAVSQHSADPLGILVITMFSEKPFQWRNSVSLIDILIAKFHASCPVLFGIYPPPAGPANLSVEAKRWLLGWRVEGKMLVDDQVHSDRMTGIATGFAAVSLRTFKSAIRKNAYPPHNYWRALSSMVNTPTDMLTPTHFLVIKNLIESQEKRIIEYFGHAGVLLMRQALWETAMRGNARADGPARRACMVLVDVIERDRKIILR